MRPHFGINPGELVQALKRWKLSHQQVGFGIPKKDGTPQDRKTVLRSALYPAIRRAEVKKLDMHALRHTFASLLLSQGTPITEVSSYLGHADPQITLKVYSHWIPRTKTDSISRLAGMVLSAKKRQKLKKRQTQRALQPKSKVNDEQVFKIDKILDTLDS